MSDMTSSSRPEDSSSVAGGQGKAPGGVPDPGSGSALPLRDDQRTIISKRPPLGTSGHTDSEDRLDSGKFAPGDMLGHYELIEYVGGGGMGRVFRALDTQLARTVALKFLPRDQASDAETLLRFRNEARSAARLDHESIARAYYVGEDRGFPYLVFEFVEGDTIRALVDQYGPLRLADALSYTLQVADALIHADERGVVHRDIKPSNVIITPEGRAKVIDLGLARLQEVREADSDLTASGVTLGTFDYISPEQARDPRTVDVRSDIYSLGCAFFYMLTGRPPFPEGTVLQKLLQHQGDKPPDIHQFRPELPDEVSQVMRKMLAKDPAHRYQTPLELVEHLQLLAEHVGLRPVGPGRRVWIAPRRRQVSLLQRHLPWMAPIAALLCIVTLLHFLWSSPPDPQVGQLPRNNVDLAPAVSDDPPPDAESVESDDKGKAATPGPASTVPGESTLPGESKKGFPLGDETGLGGLSSGNPTAAAPPRATPDPVTPPTDVALTPKRDGVLTVGDTDGGRNDFATLAAACSVAESSDIIELCYDGPREEKPIAPKATLVIRAGQGFRPVVVFRPNESDPFKYPRQMIRLTSSELSLLNVAIELDIPRDVPADRWTLLELGRAESLRLEKCSLTIRNAHHQDVAFFRVKSPPVADFLPEGGTLPSRKAAKVTLSDCIVRGEAVVVRAESLEPVDLNWTNGCLLTSGPLLWAAGGDEMPEAGQSIRVELKHLTALVESGLCRLDNSRHALQHLPTHINCSDSILMASADSPLIEQIGETSLNDPHPLFTWSGDRNYYHGFIVFWKIDDLRSDMPAERIEFEAWQTRWAPDDEIHSRWGRVDFRRSPEASRPLHAQTPADYTLTDSAENWARDAASDGTDVGFSADRLPSLPAASRMDSPAAR